MARLRRAEPQQCIMTIDMIGYVLKHKTPLLFKPADLLGRVLVWLKYREKIDRAISDACIQGAIHGKPAVMRYISVDDFAMLKEMISRVPDEHLKYFHPHAFSDKALRSVLKRKTLLTYGLICESQMQAYAILKLYPFKKAYLGRIVAPDVMRMGIGCFLLRWLYWQTRLVGFRPYVTINKDNIASLGSHASVRPIHPIATLPCNYTLFRCELRPEDRNPPILQIEGGDKVGIRYSLPLQ